MTVLCIGLVAVFTRGMIQRLLILVGLIVACLLYVVMTNVLGLGKAVDFTLVSHAAGSVCRIFPLLLLIVRQ